MRASPRRLVGLGAVTAVLVALLVPVAAHAVTEDYDSIAYSPSTHVVAAGLGFTQAGAKNAALYQCVANGGAADCWALNWFHNAAGAFARASNGAYGSGQGWANNPGEATRLANQYAIKICQQEGGTDCKVTFNANTPYVSSSGTGGAYPQPTLPATVLPVHAGTTVPPGKYEATGGVSFGTATCLATLTALGIAVYTIPGPFIEISVPEAITIGSTVTRNCGAFILTLILTSG